VTSLMQFEQQPTVQLQSSPQVSYQITYAGPAPHLITGAFQISFKVSQVTGNQLHIQLLAGGIQSPFTVFVYVSP
jgi:hypothetical protein